MLCFGFWCFYGVFYGTYWCFIGVSMGFHWSFDGLSMGFIDVSLVSPLA